MDLQHIRTRYGLAENGGQPDPSGKLLLAIEPLALVVGAILIGLIARAAEMEEQATIGHLRRERLAAYKARAKWKRSDLQPLLSIGVNEVAQRRMATLRGRGRPVVQSHRPLDEVLLERFKVACTVFDESATPHQRHRALRTTPFWKHHVEALYRAEAELARQVGIRGAYDHAEREVGRALGLSQGSVHAICGEIRAMRRKDPASADFQPYTLADHQGWFCHGRKIEQPE